LGINRVGIANPVVRQAINKNPVHISSTVVTNAGSTSEAIAIPTAFVRPPTMVADERPSGENQSAAYYIGVSLAYPVLH
jgi:hypothetical protein